MKKLMCLLLLTTLIAGCSSNDSKSKANVEGKVAENQTTNDTKKDDKKTEEENQKDSEKEDKEASKENTDTDSSNTTSQSSNKKSSDTSSQTSDKKEQSSSSNSSNGNSQSTPSQKPSQPEPTPTPTPVPDTPTEQRAKADGVMAQINAYRQQNGLTPYIVDSYLVKSASDHAYAMAEARALWHSGAAECITNYDDPFSAWKNSPPHNDMLLNNNRYGAVGIYYVDGYYFSVFQTSP